MGYFRELPNLKYLSILPERISSSEYVEAKNIFKRVKIREDYFSTLTNFTKYNILDGERPDHVAKKLYESSTLDWIVLISAGIINVRDQWPLSDRDIYDFTEKVYGTEMNETRFYETIEVKDSEGRLILPAGQIVNSNFKSGTKTTGSPSTSEISFYDNGLGIMVTKNQITKPVTNYEYETRLNNEKRSIYVLRSEYVTDFITDIRKLMQYDDSTQTLNSKLKESDNIRIKSP